MLELLWLSLFAHSDFSTNIISSWSMPWLLRFILSPYAHTRSFPFLTAIMKISPYFADFPLFGLLILLGIGRLARAGNLPSQSQLCQASPQPNAPVCPGPAANTTYTDGCGVSYGLYCGYDTIESSVSQAAASSINACMQQCDKYSGCKAAVLAAGTCYLTTAYIGLKTSGTSGIGAMVQTQYLQPPAQCQDNTLISDKQGVQYTLHCNADTTSTTVQGNLASQVYQDGDYTQCEALCDSTANCGMSSV